MQLARVVFSERCSARLGSDLDRAVNSAASASARVGQPSIFWQLVAAIEPQWMAVQQLWATASGCPMSTSPT